MRHLKKLPSICVENASLEKNLLRLLLACFLTLVVYFSFSPIYSIPVKQMEENLTNHDISMAVNVPEVSLAVNLLEGKLYPHHPVILNIPLKFFTVEKEMIVELNGLRVPAKYDCDIFNNGNSWGNHKYFYEVPSRWYNCYYHDAVLKSGMLLEMPMYPIVDDEYIETVSVYQSVMRAKPHRGFVVAEFGARWGTWGFRAAKMLEVVNPMKYSMYLVEANKVNCEGINSVGKKNNLSYDLFCDYASPSDFKRFAGLHSHIDLIDFDIQGAEQAFIEDTFDVINSKVYRLIIGTHSTDIHQKLKEKFKDWILIHEVGYSTGACQEKTMKYLRGSYSKNSPDRFDWGKLIENGCYHSTPFGKVTQWDGELILDNPKFVDRQGSFKLTDTSVITNDLIDSSVIKNNLRFDNPFISIATVAIHESELYVLMVLLNSLANNVAAQHVDLTIVCDDLVCIHIKNCTELFNSLHSVSVISKSELRHDEMIVKSMSDPQYGRFGPALLKYAMLSIVNSDSVLILDADTIVEDDLFILWDWWIKSIESSERILFGLAEEHADWYKTKEVSKKDHFYGKSGLNSGVMLMNLKLMRKDSTSIFEKLVLKNDEPTPLGDQDLVNTWAYYNPKSVEIIPCRWNFRPHYFGTSLQDNKIGIAHGTNGLFRRNSKIPKLFKGKVEPLLRMASKYRKSGFCIIR